MLRHILTGAKNLRLEMTSCSLSVCLFVCFETTCVALAPGTHCVNQAGFELSGPPASASCDIKVLRHRLQLPGLLFNSAPMGLWSALHCGEMGLQSYGIVFEM